MYVDILIKSLKIKIITKKNPITLAQMLLKLLMIQSIKCFAVTDSVVAISFGEVYKVSNMLAISLITPCSLSRFKVGTKIQYAEPKVISETIRVYSNCFQTKSKLVVKSLNEFL